MKLVKPSRPIKMVGLKVKILLSTILLAVISVAIIDVIVPHDLVINDSHHGSLDTRFYYGGDYEEKSSNYKYEVYKKLKAERAEATSEDATNTGANNTSATEPDVMSGIVVAEADNSPYTRSDYGSGWDVSGLNCNIRATILKSTSLVSVQTAKNGCTVTYGSWVDPYTGATLTGNPYQGDGTSNDLDIDHVIPLKYVNSHGGYAWSSSDKIAYGKSLTAMNNGVYLAVSASENRRKKDLGPADYYPSNPDYHCEYSHKWRDIARTYSISLSSRDYEKIKGVLKECNIN